jgi:hypothetical protein
MLRAGIVGIVGELVLRLRFLFCIIAEVMTDKDWVQNGFGRGWGFIS